MMAGVRVPFDQGSMRGMIPLLLEGGQRPPRDGMIGIDLKDSPAPLGGLIECLQPKIAFGQSLIGR